MVAASSTWRSRASGTGSGFRRRTVRVVRRASNSAMSDMTVSSLRQLEAGGDVVLLHVRRAADDRHHADVAHVALHVVAVGAAVRAHDALAGEDDLDGGVADEELRHRR